MLDQFIASFDKPPRQLTLDIDPFDDPTHGQQQLTFFHGYYEQYQYLPRVITCAENDLVCRSCLLHGTAHAALGAEDDLEYVVRRLREVWPDVRIHLRGDSGFGVPAMYEACEQLDIEYTIGIGMNARLKKLQRFPAGTQRLRSGRPRASRNGCSRRSGIGPIPGRPSAGSSSSAKPMPKAPIGARWSPIGRARSVLPGAAYDDYADRGESENRNKELKTRLHWPTGSAIIATSPTCSASICTRRRTTCWFTCGSVVADPPRRSATARTFPSKLSPAAAVATGTTAAVSTIRWAKASPARGGRG